MRKKPNNKMIGIFIVCGVALFIATIGMFVSNRLLQNSDRLAVMYFSESIKGLDVGSPVIFKGVSVGRVVKIDVITDVQKLDFIIPIYVAFNNQKIASRQHHESVQQLLQEMVAKGLRARLATQNFLTGQLMIELEYVPSDEKPVYHHSVAGKVPEIPTVLSQFAEISQGIQELPLRETIRQFGSFMDKLNNTLLPDFNKLINDFETIPASTRTVPETLNNFSKAMQNISNAAKSLGNFTDYLERHPESLLRGKGGY